MSTGVEMDYELNITLELGKNFYFKNNLFKNNLLGTRGRLALGGPLHGHAYPAYHIATPLLVCRGQSLKQTSHLFRLS